MRSYEWLYVDRECPEEYPHLELFFTAKAATGQISTQAIHSVHGNLVASFSPKELIVVSKPRLAKVRNGLSCIV